MSVSEHLERRLIDLMSMSNNTLGRLPKLGAAPVLGDWSDSKLFELRDKLSFPKSAYSRANLQSILARFYNLYFMGSIDKHDNLVAVVFDTIAIAETDQGRIWKAPDGEETGFYEQNRSQVQRLTATASYAFPEVLSPNPWGAPGDLSVFMDRYTAPQTNEFRDHVQLLIEGISPVDAPTTAEKKLIMLTAFLALTLLRSSIRKKTQMSYLFSKTQYKNDLSMVASWPAGSPWSPPCTQCLALCEQGLQKTLKTTSKMFTILANELVQSHKAGYENTSVLPFLSVSVLTDTALNGLGIIRMVDKVSQITGLTWQGLKQKTCWNVPSHSWNVISKFYNTYCVEGSVEHGYNWARIINHGYLRGLQPKDNIFLAIVLTTIIAKKEGEGVWSAEWAKGGASDINAAKTLGEALYRSLHPEGGLVIEEVL